MERQSGGRKTDNPYKKGLKSFERKTSKKKRGEKSTKKKLNTGGSGEPSSGGVSDWR